MKYWMFNCREVSRLVSESVDRKIPTHRRLGVKIHLLMCRFCSRYSKQIRLLGEIVRLYAESVPDRAHGALSSHARQRIKSAINEKV
jgi:hypothetical protein